MALTDQDKSFLSELKAEGKSFSEAMSILEQVKASSAPVSVGAVTGQAQATTPKVREAATEKTFDPSRLKVSSPLPGIIPPTSKYLDKGETGEELDISGRLKSAASGAYEMAKEGMKTTKEGAEMAMEASKDLRSGNILEGIDKSYAFAPKMLRGALETLISPIVGSAAGYFEPEVNGFVETVSNAYNALPEEARQKMETAGETISEYTPETVKEYGKFAGEFLPVEKVANPVLKKVWNKFKSTPVKATAEVEKLATELLQPSKKELVQAKMNGGNTTDGVKEYIKIAEEIDDFDTAAKMTVEKTNDIFNKRNEIIKSNNYKIETTKPLSYLENEIKKAEKSKLVSKSDLKAMKEVLDNEKAWLAENSPNRFDSQMRKEAMYNEATPLFKKSASGNLVGNEAGKVKAYELLGKGYKDVVEGGNQVIKDLNARYGGLMSAVEMLHNRGALSMKSFSPTLIQSLADPIVTLLSGATGAGSAAFVMKTAARQQAKLSKLTKKLVELRDKAGINGNLKKELDAIIDESRLLPAAGEASPSSPGIIESSAPQRKFKEIN